jgi:hypothetical protein
LAPERHKVIALEGPQAYAYGMPVYKDLGSTGMLYCRSYGGRQMLVSEGTSGETLSEPRLVLVFQVMVLNSRLLLDVYWRNKHLAYLQM